MKEGAGILSSNCLNYATRQTTAGRGQDANIENLFVLQLELFCGRQEQAEELQRSQMRRNVVCVWERGVRH